MWNKTKCMIPVCSSDFPFNTTPITTTSDSVDQSKLAAIFKPSLNTAWVEPQLPQRKSEAVMLQQSFPGARAKAGCTIQIEGNLDDKTPSNIRHAGNLESFHVIQHMIKSFDLHRWLPELFPPNTAYGPEVVGLSQWNWDARAQNRRNLGCSKNWSREGWYVRRSTLRISDDDDDDYAIGTSALNMKQLLSGSRRSTRSLSSGPQPQLLCWQCFSVSENKGRQI